MPRRDRRLAPRVEYRDGVLPPSTRIRPGGEVVVVNLSGVGALVEGACRFQPGGLVDLRLVFDAKPIAARGRVLRSFVCRIDRVHGVRYRAAIALSTPIVVPDAPALREVLEWIAAGDGSAAEAE
jgi:hypothetical protein